VRHLHGLPNENQSFFAVPRGKKTVKTSGNHGRFGAVSSRLHANSSLRRREMGWPRGGPESEARAMQMQWLGTGQGIGRHSTRHFASRHHGTAPPAGMAIGNERGGRGTDREQSRTRERETGRDGRSAPPPAILPRS